MFPWSFIKILQEVTIKIIVACFLQKVNRKAKKDFPFLVFFDENRKKKFF